MKIRFLLLAASYNTDDDNKDGKCNGNNNEEWILLFLNLDHLRSCINHYSLVLINSIRLILNLHCDIVVSDLLFDKNLKIWVEIVGSSLVALRIDSIH